MITTFKNTDSRELPDHSRVWIYQASKELTDQEVSEISDKTEDFIAGWAAHGNKLTASYEICYNRFLVIILDEELAAASGCSIDSSVHFIQNLEKEYEISLLDRMHLAYKEGDTVKVKNLADFQKELKSGSISEDTIVFNNLVQTKKEFRESWEVPLKDSWHKQLL